MIRGAHFALFYLPLFLFLYYIPISLFLTMSLSLSYFTVPILVILSSCLPAQSLSWLAPILLHVFSLPLSFLLFSKLCNARQTTSPLSTPEYSFFSMPFMHCWISLNGRPLSFLQALPLHSFTFSFFVPRSSERTGLDEKETYSLVYPCLHKINAAPAIPQGARGQ